jgi:hypothetical protein
MFPVTNVYGWSNGGYSTSPSNPLIGTHDWIVEKAVNLLPSNESQIFKDHMNWLKYGTELPDRPKSEGGIADTFNHHVYFDEEHRVFDDAAAVRAYETYYEALNLLEQSNLTGGVMVAGTVSHYISDLAVWGHVMGADTPWGPEEHHDDYEGYVNEHQFLFEDAISLIEPLNHTSPYQATLDLASDTMFRDPNATWMDNNYDWNDQQFTDRAGESLNLAVNYVANALHTLWLDALQNYCLIAFDISPANIGTITFDEDIHDDGDTVWKLFGTYNITANTGSYGFHGWETSGNISVTDSNSAATTCTISGNGTLRIAQIETPTPTPPQGCVIATATYGSEMAPEATYMRHVRDEMIGSNEVGKQLVNGWNTFYYSWSPILSSIISNSETLQATFKILLLPLVAIIHYTAFIYSAIAPFSLTSASIFAFMFAAFTSIVIYFVIPVMVLLIIFKRLRVIRTVTA